MRRFKINNFCRSFGFILVVFAYCNFSLLQCAEDHRAVQTYDLGFIANDNHRPIVRNYLSRMHQEIDAAVEVLTQQNASLTLLSSARLVLFYDDDSHQVIHADRGRDFIYMLVNRVSPDRPAPGALNPGNRTIFCASDRTHHRRNLAENDPLIPEVDNSIDMSIARGERILPILNPPIELLDVVNPLANSRQNGGDAGNYLTYKSQEEYIGFHIDDGEGFAVDQLVSTIEMEDAREHFRFENVRTIYSLVCTERDPCRCCLVSVRDYLTERINVQIPNAELIQPIVVSRGIYHEEVKIPSRHDLPEGVVRPRPPQGVIEPRIALRIHYPRVLNPIEPDDQGPVVYLCRPDIVLLPIQLD